MSKYWAMEKIKRQTINRFWLFTLLIQQIETFRTKFKSIDCKYIILLFFSLSLSLRLAAALYFKTYELNNEWSFGYEAGQIAESLARGTGFSSPFPGDSGPTAWLAPGYPIILSIIFIMFGTFSKSAAIAAIALNSFLSALTVIPVYKIGERVFNRETGLLAIALYAIYLPSIWHSINTIWDTSLYTLLSMILINWLICLNWNQNIGKQIYFGIYAGLLILVNPVIASYYPVILWWIYTKTNTGIKDKVIFCLLFLISVTVTISPWLLRNYQKFGSFWLKSNLGNELYISNNFGVWEAFTASKNANKDMSNYWINIHPSNNSEEFQLYKELGEAQYVRNRQKEAISFIVKNPLKFSLLTYSRILRFWIGPWGSANKWKGNIKTSIDLSRLKLIANIIFLPFFFVGLLIAFKEKRELCLLIGYLFVTPMAYYITNVSQRYKYPLDPIILIIAAFGMLGILSLRHKRKGK